MHLVQCQTEFRKRIRMTNVNHRSAFIPAEMLIRAHSTVTTVLQPPWLRARGTFFCVVDNTVLNVIRFTPPLLNSR